MLSVLESEIDRNPYSVKLWCRYIELKNSDVLPVYKKALGYLPRSYKLWRAYLQEKQKRIESIHIPTDSILLDIIDSYENALHYLNKMPRLWCDFVSLLSKTSNLSLTRRTFDRALKALPITQHYEIWDQFIEWCRFVNIPELSIRIYRRYVMFNPSSKESILRYLVEIQQFDEAIFHLTLIHNQGQRLSHELLVDIIEKCCLNAQMVSKSTELENLIRYCIIHYSDEIGQYWCKLAEFYVSQGSFQRAFDIFEEAIHSVSTVKDFTIIFESYVRITESIITQQLEESNESSLPLSLLLDRDGEKQGELGNVDFYLSKLEYLVENRSLLINSVYLRQNPNNIFEWIKRTKLLKNDDDKLLITFIEALKTVDPNKAVGKISTLWLGLIGYYENRFDYNSVRSVFTKALQFNFKNLNELAFLWCMWAEFEIRRGDEKAAFTVLDNALKESSYKSKQNELSNNNSSSKLHLNVKLWSFYLDIEESLGSVDSVRAAYNKVFDLGVITVKMVLNFGSYLEKHHYFEESFQVYEKAVTIFYFPEVRVIWLKYLNQFINRYKESKLERLRDIFEQVISKSPPDFVAEFFIMYSKVEEEYGYERNAISLIDRAIKIVSSQQRFNMYLILLRKVERFYGITKTRPIYERAISDLDDESSKLMCLDYGDTERKLGEIDRARAILRHGSQLADPQRDLQYWEYWKQFEEAHGNEDTFREMLRIKRSVQATYSQVHYIDIDVSTKVNNSEIQTKRARIDDKDENLVSE